ncbi:transposase [Kineosporia sp. A_224]|uniref:IS110 family transposase n=1 Tax=Kineosporia sp. A_224 TaxID=1962180 RepID=UPI000B4BE1BD
MPDRERPVLLSQHAIRAPTGGDAPIAPTKSDTCDALVLADSLRHQHEHWRPLAVPSPLLAELRAPTRDRERLVWNRRDVENQLRRRPGLPPGRCVPGRSSPRAASGRTRERSSARRGHRTPGTPQGRTAPVLQPRP